MSLLNSAWISFAGEPITGKVPPRMVIHAAPGFALSHAQYSAVAHAFKLFKDAVAGSPHAGMYHVQNRKLPDGSVLRMVSNSGLDMVDVWPVGGVSSGLASDLFIAIPASMDHMDGYLPPEAQFGMPKVVLRWRKYLKQPMPDPVPEPWNLVWGPPLSDHPGHITWSSAKFKLAGHEVQLSWRGPDSRYSTSTGWSDLTGGTVEAHEQDGVFIGPRNTTHMDSSRIWFGKKPVDTGIQKIIAAALHRPSPIMNPSHVVLRVCTDMYPQPSSTRGLAVYDLVAAGGDPEDCTLVRLMETASTLVVKDVYPAAGYKPNVAATDTGMWESVQRPHFDSGGGRIATVIREPSDVSGSVGAVGAVFSLPAWTRDQQVNLPWSSSGSRTETQDITGDSNQFVAYSLSADSSLSKTSIVAMDFLHDTDPDGGDDTAVYVLFTESTAESFSATGNQDSTFMASSGSYTSSESKTFTYTLSHSVHGVLFSYTHTGSSGTTADWAESLDGGSYSVASRSLVNPRFTFVGDLSRDVFAVGWSSALISSGASGAAEFVSSDFGVATVSGPATTNYTTRLDYDVYFDGTKVASGIEGGPAPTSNAGGSGGSFLGDMFNIGIFNGPASASSVYGTMYIPFYGPRFEHIATDTTRRIAYIGYHGRGTPNTQLSVIVRNLAPGSPGDIIEPIPTYIPGLYQTLAAPIFLGAVPITG